MEAPGIRLLDVIVALLVASQAYCALESVPDLEKAMYPGVHGQPCVRLLSVYGESGCANPGRDKVVAPILRLTTLEIHSRDPVVVLLPYSLLHIFLEKTEIDAFFEKQVAGVLVEFQVNSTDGSNPDDMFPQATFAPYARKDYRWNPSGTGVLHKRYNFPIHLLSEQSTVVARKAAAGNWQQRHGNRPVHVAEFDVVMQTTKSGTHTSVSCLRELTCLPLGGFSVLSAFPPMKEATAKPILLVVAAMDSASFFRDMTLGADSPLSGLIAVLVAVDALSKSGWFSNPNKQVVFLVCKGESWGYLGSRRFLYDLEAGSPHLTGLDRSRLHQILEVGSVGRATNATYYAHSQASSEVQEIMDALNDSVQGLSVEVRMASDKNPGVPPSSLMAFLQKNSSLAGVVLEEFDTAFINNLYHSHLDNAENIHLESITGAATVLARTVARLVGNGPSSVVANASLVSELVSCLFTSSPGMSCDLVRSLTTPTQRVPNHYPGVYLGGSPTAENVNDDTAQFVWSFLADRTKRVDSDKPAVGCSKSCDNPSEVCLRGVCVVSTTRYVPAYSTRLKLNEAGRWELLPVEGDVMDSVDPVWTESFWKSLSVRVYLREDPSMDRFIFFLGLTMTVASAAAILYVRSVFRQRLKSA